MVSDILMNQHSLCQPGATSIFQWPAAHLLRRAVNVCLCFSFFLSLSCTSSHLCSEPPATEEIVSDNRIRTISIQPLRERSCRCTAHSDSWGQGQMGALIGPVKAPNTPLWSELTAIGWLFISNCIAVDPLVEGLQLLFFFCRLHIFSESRPLTGKVFKMCSKLQSPQMYLFFVTVKILSTHAVSMVLGALEPQILGSGSEESTTAPLTDLIIDL